MTGSVGPMSDRLSIGLLQCGTVNPTVAAANGGDYPELFASLLGPHGVDLTTYDVEHGPVPADLGAHDGWLVSGSASSAYEDLPWIAPMEDVLRKLVADERPTVAVCFGHQLLAQAMGGRVERSARGWGVGVHRYELVGPARLWMDPPAESGGLNLIASHQDQVVVAPDGAEVFARTEHCPIAGFTLGPRMLAVQPHPEFSAGVSGGLVALRREAIGADCSDAALASLEEPLEADRDRFAAWMAAFWRL